jgi:ATP-dependent Clp protease protease subunit
MADSDTKSGDLRDNGIYLFAEDVGEESFADAIEFILESNLQDDPKFDHLTLIVNSRGGSCFDGFALLDVMAGSRLPVYTVGIGIIASMGLLLFMGGRKGHRILTPNTMILSHQWSAFEWGKEHELIAGLKKNELLSGMIMKHYKKCTGLNQKQIKEILLPPSDVWLSAEDALKYGICDEIKLI